MTSEIRPSCFGNDDCSTMALVNCPVKDECEIQSLRNDLKYYQEEVDKLRKLVDKFKTIVKHAQAERTGVFFISGSSEPGKDGLPDYIEVCPGFGSDGSAMYKKITPLSSPEY